MSNSDSFIDEVTEEVRRDRLFAVFRRYGWVAIALIVLIVAGAAYTEWQRSQAATEAQATGDGILAALKIEDPIARAGALAEIGAEGERGVAVAFMEAGALRQGGDSQRAAERLAEIEAMPEIGARYRQLATLKRVALAGAGLPPDDRIAALTPLTGAGAPYRLLAEEQIAVAEAEKGDSDAAIARLTSLLGEQGVTASLRQRASQLIVALGGELGAG